MQHAATRERTAAAMENLVVLSCREEAVRARHPTWMPAYALDTIYWGRRSIRSLLIRLRFSKSGATLTSFGVYADRRFVLSGVRRR